MAPLLGEPLGCGLIPCEGAIDVHLIAFGQQIGRPEIGERVIGRRLSPAGENADQSVHGLVSFRAQALSIGDR
jgi:hypothetical protein